MIPLLFHGENQKCKYQSWIKINVLITLLIIKIKPRTPTNMESGDSESAVDDPFLYSTGRTEKCENRGWIQEIVLILLLNVHLEPKKHRSGMKNLLSWLWILIWTLKKMQKISLRQTKCFPKLWDGVAPLITDTQPIGEIFFNISGP